MRSPVLNVFEKKRRIISAAGSLMLQVARGYCCYEVTVCCALLQLNASTDALLMYHLYLSLLPFQTAVV